MVVMLTAFLRLRASDPSVQQRRWAGHCQVVEKQRIVCLNLVLSSSSTGREGYLAYLRRYGQVLLMSGALAKQRMHADRSAVVLQKKDWLPKEETDALQRLCHNCWSVIVLPGAVRRVEGDVNGRDLQSCEARADVSLSRLQQVHP
jgi:hypothetical protein